jgi:glutamine amidotransferase
LSRLVLVDYGSGNVGSLMRGLKEAGQSDVWVAQSPGEADGAAGLIVPGVGAFASGMDRLRRDGWSDTIREHASRGGFVLGICAGMQYLASRGDEGGDRAGLDLIPGDIVSLESLGCTLRLPHVGWTPVATDGHPMFAGIPSRTDFYFSHRYTMLPADPKAVVGHFDYGIIGTAAVSSGNIHGIQFHPEKSSFAGIRVLKNVTALAAA